MQSSMQYYAAESAFFQSLHDAHPRGLIGTWTLTDQQRSKIRDWARSAFVFGPDDEPGPFAWRVTLERALGLLVHAAQFYARTSGPRTWDELMKSAVEGSRYGGAARRDLDTWENNARAVLRAASGRFQLLDGAQQYRATLIYQSGDLAHLLARGFSWNAEIARALGTLGADTPGFWLDRKREWASPGNDTALNVAIAHFLARKCAEARPRVKGVPALTPAQRAQEALHAWKSAGHSYVPSYEQLVAIDAQLAGHWAVVEQAIVEFGGGHSVAASARPIGLRLERHGTEVLLAPALPDVLALSGVSLPPDVGTFRVTRGSTQLAVYQRGGAGSWRCSERNAQVTWQVDAAADLRVRATGLSLALPVPEPRLGVRWFRDASPAEVDGPDGVTAHTLLVSPGVRLRLDGALLSEQHRAHALEVGPFAVVEVLDEAGEVVATFRGAQRATRRTFEMTGERVRDVVRLLGTRNADEARARLRVYRAGTLTVTADGTPTVGFCVRRGDGSPGSEVVTMVKWSGRDAWIPLTEPGRYWIGPVGDVSAACGMGVQIVSDDLDVVWGEGHVTLRVPEVSEWSCETAPHGVVSLVEDGAATREIVLDVADAGVDCVVVAHTELGRAGWRFDVRGRAPRAWLVDGRDRGIDGAIGVREANGTVTLHVEGPGGARVHVHVEAGDVGADWTYTLDSDGTTTPEDLGRTLRTVLLGALDGGYVSVEVAGVEVLWREVPARSVTFGSAALAPRGRVHEHRLVLEPGAASGRTDVVGLRVGDTVLPLQCDGRIWTCDLPEGVFPEVRAAVLTGPDGTTDVPISLQIPPATLVARVNATMGGALLGLWQSAPEKMVLRVMDAPTDFHPVEVVVTLRDEATVVCALTLLGRNGRTAYWSFDKPCKPPEISGWWVSGTLAPLVVPPQWQAQGIRSLPWSSVSFDEAQVKNGFLVVPRFAPPPVPRVVPPVPPTRASLTPEASGEDAGGPVRPRGIKRPRVFTP